MIIFCILYHNSNTRIPLKVEIRYKIQHVIQAYSMIQIIINNITWC